MIVQAPTVLTQFTRPLTVADSQVRCAQVYGIEGTKKRKRHELAVGVDGEAINIYNVQSGKLITSYAVPPQSAFSCQPTSARYTKKSDTPERRTYCSFAGPEAEIWCFTEKETTGGKAQFATNKYSLDNPENSVVYVDTLVDENSTNTPDLLVVRKDGQIQRLRADLKRQIWSVRCGSSLSANHGSRQIIAAMTASPEQAELGIFQSRPDITSELSSGSLLVLIIRETESQSSSRHRIVFQAHTLSGSASASTGVVKALFIKDFPRDHERWSSKANVQINIDAAKGTVDVSFEKGIITYDVTGYTIQSSSKLLPETDVFSSLLRVSPSLVVAASSSAISVYDLKYNSILSRLAIDQLLVNRKRKRAIGHAMEQPIIFVAFYQRLGVLIALRGNALVSLDLTVDDTSRGLITSRRRDGLLVNAIGKGFATSSSKDIKRPKDLGPGFGKPVVYRNREYTDQWVSRKVFLDDLFQRGDFEQFENELILELRNSAGNEITAEDASARPMDGALDLEIVFYAITKCFSLSKRVTDVVEEGSETLEADARVARLLQWLIRNDLVTLSSIRAAFASVSHGSELKLAIGSIHRALTTSSQSVQLLKDLLETTTSLETIEVVSIIQEYVVAALTSKTMPVEHDLKDDIIMNGHSSEPKADTRSLKATLLATSHDEFLVVEGMKRLKERPRAEVVSAIRSGLRMDVLLALIQFLRLLLFQGGYTTSFRAQPLSTRSGPVVTDAQDPTASLSDAISLDLDAIIKLMSCCIDALGSSAVLSNDDDFIQSIITDMRTEISSALEGVEEASYLQGILREVWRYAASGTEEKALSAGRQHSGDARPGDIVTLLVQPPEEQFDSTATSGMLPLGLRMEAGINDYKVRKGGGQILQRSGREKAGLQSRAIGKYSLERLVL